MDVPEQLRIAGTDAAAGKLLAGVDEAGRGPLAGSVVAAAVILDPARPIAGLNEGRPGFMQNLSKIGLTD